MLLISLGEVVAINYTLTTLTLLYAIEVQKQSIIMRASNPFFSEQRDFNKRHIDLWQSLNLLTANDNREDYKIIKCTISSCMACIMEDKKLVRVGL